MIFKNNVKSNEYLPQKFILLPITQVLTKWKSYNIMDLTLKKMKNICEMRI